MQENTGNNHFSPTVESVRNIIQSSQTRTEKLMALCQLLNESVPYYHWVGFYIADHRKKELNLGPFVGDPTEHVKIPFGRGVCGQAAETLDTIVVQNVGLETNYLSCGVDVKSEIVVPVFKDGRFVAELDIDSHAEQPFTEKDKAMLENLCRQISSLF
ncbi:MAG TPA: histidine kinase [Candidatus Marinimicrobia bacterium]|nr:histidine kinase [Candidatus Neomarinimicrobiota bacterium]